ncbi:PREDICTED: uncharacterized protein LOC18602387 [Theobroma cacao]|uniref:Uncharacterized protein LOC18602387 n=1 Tax=Theobroma cacao TaxID=3641 RepID=A0AB32V8W4_THECC|nr:PREDICTED: uncharacterized protein LOC18602387 [Theobroma cacao]
MSMEMKYLDCILVPLGILTMVAYHIWQLHRIIKHPTKTIIGVNAISRRFWVHSMMEDVGKNGVLAVQTLRNNIMASTVLASTAIMLSSLIALLMSNTGRDKSMWLDFGDRSEQAFSIKYFSILVCFMAVFLLNVQSIRYYSHASILINIPFKKMYSDQHHRNLTAEYVATTVNRGSYFWSLGLRGFYFSLPLFLWIFGPIPMILCCFVLVFMLYFLDVNVEFGSAVSVADDNRDGNEDDAELGGLNSSV